MSTYRDKYSDRQGNRHRTNSASKQRRHHKSASPHKHNGYHGYSSDDEVLGHLTPHDPDRLTPGERKKLLEKRIKQLEENEKKILELQLKDRISQQASRYSERSRGVHSHVSTGEVVQYLSNKSNKSYGSSRVSSPPTFRSNFSHEHNHNRDNSERHSHTKNRKYGQSEQNKYFYTETEINSNARTNPNSDVSHFKHAYSDTNSYYQEHLKQRQEPRFVKEDGTDSEMKRYESVRRISRDYRANILNKAERMIEDRKRKESGDSKSDDLSRVQEYVKEHQDMFLKQQEKRTRNNRAFVSKRPRSPPSDSEYIEVPESADSDTEIPSEFRVRTIDGNRWYNRDIPSAIRVS